MIEQSVIGAFIIAVAVTVFMLDIATKTKSKRLVLLILGVILGFIYVTAGTQGFTPSLVFDMMTFLLMLSMLVWGIRKRQEKRRPTADNDEE